MIIGITTVLDEAPIIGQTIGHLLAQGVEWVIASDGGSTDGTRTILEENPQVIWRGQIGPLYQDEEMTRLAHHAADLGATWIVPFDADEFWCDLEILDLYDRQQDLQVPINRVAATMWQHRTWDLRHVDPKLLPKTAFRPYANMQVAWGNHDVAGIPGGVAGGLTIREWQYRDWDHFLAKIEKAARLYGAADFPLEYGSHMRRLVAMSDEEKRQEWAMMQAVPTVYDPIPFLG